MLVARDEERFLHGRREISFGELQLVTGSASILHHLINRYRDILSSLSSQCGKLRGSRKLDRFDAEPKGLLIGVSSGRSRALAREKVDKLGFLMIILASGLPPVEVHKSLNFEVSLLQAQDRFISSGETGMSTHYNQRFGSTRLEPEDVYKTATRGTIDVLCYFSWFILAASATHEVFMSNYGAR